MADEQKDQELHRAVRQGWALNDKQVKYGGGTLAALYLVAQLKGALWTREEGNAGNEKLAAVAKSVDDLRAENKKAVDDLKKGQSEQAAEIIRVVERKTDKLIEMSDKQEARTQRDIDRITARVENLELITSPKKATR